MKHYDVVIIGGGMVGASLACLLAKLNIQIAVVEATLPKQYQVDDPYDLRVSAISHFSHQVLIDTGAWPLIAAMRVSPYEAMQVWEAQGQGIIHFNAADMGAAQLGHIIENRIIQLGLLTVLKSYKNIELIAPARLQQIEKTADKVILSLDTGVSLCSRLVVGADGASSPLRQLANIAVQRQDYGQHGLVAVVETEKSHQNTAWQCFLATGPIAFLPLADKQCSIVWTLPSDQVDKILALSDTDFKQQLTQAIAGKLGNIHTVSQRAAFPLKGSQAENYVQTGIALVGDAAHTIHPLAGLGVNLGIKDAAKLAEILTHVPIHQYGHFKVLRRYERARRSDNYFTMKAMEAFSLLFGHGAESVKRVRNAGLNFFNQSTAIKQFLIKQAMGKGSF